MVPTYRAELRDERRVSFVGNRLGDPVHVDRRRIEPHVRRAHDDALHLHAWRSAQPAVHGAHAVLAGHAFDGEMQWFHDALNVVRLGTDPRSMNADTVNAAERGYDTSRNADTTRACERGYDKSRERGSRR